MGRAVFYFTRRKHEQLCSVCTIEQSYSSIMPLLQPPGPDIRSSDLTYTDAYNSIVSRVRRSGGSGSGGVVILCGVDAVSDPNPQGDSS
jgi:hypothetical protein